MKFKILYHRQDYSDCIYLIPNLYFWIKKCKNHINEEYLITLGYCIMDYETINKMVKNNAMFKHNIGEIYYYSIYKGD